MGFFDEWLKKGKPDPDKLERDALESIDRYDRQDMARIAKEMKDFRVAHDALCDIADTGDHLWSDSFFAFMKAVPTLRPAGEMRPSFLINRAVMEEVLKLPEYERLRTWTEGDIVSSAAACVTIEPDLESLYDRAKKHAEEAQAFEQQQQELLAAQQGQRDLDQMIQDWQALQDPEDEEAQQRAQELADLQQQVAEAIEQAQKELGQGADDLEAGAQAAARGAVASLRASMGEAADEAEKLNMAARGWGMEPGELQKLSAAERIKLAERLKNPKFDRIAELWGPMSRIANAEQMRKVYHSNEEVYDVSTGNDLSRVLPQEFATLRHPTMKLDFYKKYIEEKLLQYEMRGTEKVGKGGIIMELDNSGSMQGDPEMWAKAVGLCALHIAREQKRTFYGVHFSGRSQMRTYDFRKPEDITVDRVLDYAEAFFGGGTDFMGPLDHALGLLEAEFAEKGHVDGDIVFVTDGICGVTEEWLANFKARQEVLGFKVWGIMIGGYRESEPLWTICDHQVVTITDLLTGDEVREMFREL